MKIESLGVNGLSRILEGNLSASYAMKNWPTIKQSNLERHFQRKHSDCAEIYPVGDARKKVVEELQLRAKRFQNVFVKWVKSSNDASTATFVISHEIGKCGKPFTDFEYIEYCFISATMHLFRE